MSKVRDLVTSTEKLVPSTRRSSRSSFAGFRRADEEEKKLVKEERHQIELEKIAREAIIFNEKVAEQAVRIKAIEDEEKRIVEEQKKQNKIIRTDFIKDKISNAFGTKTKIDSGPTRQSVVDNILPKAFVPEQTYPEPFEEEPLLNKELADFKKKINEHLHKMGFAGSGGGGAARINDMTDVDTSGREDGDLLIYNSSTNKYTFSSTPNINQLSLEDSIDGNLLIDGTDASSTAAGDDFLLESGVNSGRDFEHNVLQELTSNIIPKAGDTYDLGSETKRFKNLYLSSATVNLGGATISSDGSGTITISADGVTLPTGSKDADGFVLARTTAASEGGQMFKLVKLFTQASGLTTAAVEFKFNGRKANTAVYTEAGHVFTLSNGDARSDAGADIFQF